MRIRRLISNTLVGTGAGTMLAGAAFGQEPQVEEILVEGVQRRDSYLQDENSIGKLTESLLDTPQSVTTLSSQMMQDRNVMSLDEALRNVPGITLGAGEFSWQGNNPSVRGFSSRNDMFLDGCAHGQLADPSNSELARWALIRCFRPAAGREIEQKKPLQENCGVCMSTWAMPVFAESRRI